MYLRCPREAGAAARAAAFFLPIVDEVLGVLGAPVGGGGGGWEVEGSKGASVWGDRKAGGEVGQ